jgi:hypothetical protein
MKASRLLAGSLAGLVLLAASVAVAAPAAARTDAARARTAVGFIASQQRRNGSVPAFSPVGSTADAVVSMVAARRGKTNIKRAIAYLGRRVSGGGATGVGLEGKVAMAAVAAGKNPKQFGGLNLISAIRSTERPDGRYGADTAVFDDALAMLALEAAGVAPSAKARSWLAGAQCPDGGWQYDQPHGAGEDAHCVDSADPGGDFFESDTNTTSLAVQALDAGGGPTPSANPFVFFGAIRDAEHHGWGYTWGFQTTDANSTALVLQAYASRGRTPPASAVAALRSLQYGACGALAFTWVDPTHRGAPDIGGTVGGVLGLLHTPFPVRAGVVTKQAPNTPACR